MKKQIYELLIDEEDNSVFTGVDAIGLVTEPAIEVDMEYFNKTGANVKHKVNKYILANVDTEERVIIGPALIPDKQIYRYDANADEEYYVFFSADTIKKIEALFFKNKFNSNITLQHEHPIEDVYTFESWIKVDAKKDKSCVYGFDDLPVGTWFLQMKIDNEDIWKQIKDGSINGLSVEANMVAMLSNFKKNVVTELSDEEIVEQIKQLVLNIKF